MIEISWDDRAVVERLRQLRKAGENLAPAMQDIAAILEDNALEAFDAEQAPDGERWAELSPVTQALRQKRRKWPGQKLQASSRLVQSIVSSHDDDTAVAGTNVIYAALQQFGARRGAFGRDARGRPMPWGDVPARPFLGVSDAGRKAIRQVLLSHFREAD